MLLQFIQSRVRQAGLVYVRRRTDAEDLAIWLQQQGFSTTAYHAGLGSQRRRQIEADWIGGGDALCDLHLCFWHGD